MNASELSAVARAMTAPGKGILAADESIGTITRRFDGVGLECTAATRRAYREMLFSADGLDQRISGVILFDETGRALQQSALRIWATSGGDAAAAQAALMARARLNALPVAVGTQPVASKSAR
jgi:fructose-bisphosphate aldolase class 1